MISHVCMCLSSKEGHVIVCSQVGSRSCYFMHPFLDHDVVVM